jgi:CubicO group peptidase (beta-lactamase class C family)
MRKYNVPGLVIGIFRDGKVFFAQGYGTANLAFNIPISVEMQFRI